MLALCYQTSAKNTKTFSLLTSNEFSFWVISMSPIERTVLIVGDSPEDCELYRRCLLRDRQYDYQILTANWGQFGWDLWQRHQPDVVLLDARLPDMDSLEFIAAAKVFTKQSFLPVIVVAKEGNEAIALLAIEAGAEEYLIKEQITAESLRLAINGTLKTVQLRTQLQLQNPAQAVAESQERFRQLAENIDAVFWIVDLPDRHINYVSPAYERLWGLKAESLYTRREAWIDLIYPEERGCIERAFKEKAAAGKFDEEYRIILPDGRVRWVRDRCFPLKNEAGMIYRFTGIAEDITDRKELEVERDRILQLEKSARAELERTNRIKDEFLAVLSHELRSPLNPILGWTKLLQTRKFDVPKTAEALAIIERNAKLQIQLIDDLLDIAKILRGKLSLNASPVNLRLLIESAIETVETAAAAKSIAISAVLPNIGQVSGDAVRLQQIVWNLLSNAIKFTPNGGRVEIRLEQIDGEAQIVVSDTGKGIKSDFLPHIFESFCQEDASVTRQHGGLGLGLAIVYSLVELHGGTIAADSGGEAQGATFTVRLPLLKAEPDVKQPEETFKREFDLGGIRVLAIDDEADSRELLSVLLAEYGAQVMAVASHSEFLEAVESFAPDVLVSDIGMPEVDGYSLLRQVRCLSPDRGGKIPAIALTAYARVEDFQRALAAGFQMHVSKPVDPAVLAAAIFDLWKFEYHNAAVESAGVTKL